MATKKMCLVCGAISDQPRCRIHRTRQARGYDKAHFKARAAAINSAPYCWKCGCRDCSLEWHHVEPLHGGRNPYADNRRQLLCKRCHDNVKDT